LRKLTAHNDAFLAELKLGAVEDIRFKSKGGAEIHGLIVKPPSFVAGRKYPTVLWVHGGPNGQDDHSLVLDGYQFEPQMFAAKGFIVLRVNYRGGSGRGAAFAKAIFADWGRRVVHDLFGGVVHIVTRSIADPAARSRGGAGGILTDYTIASDSRFKATISGASANQLNFGSDEYILNTTMSWDRPGAWRCGSRCRILFRRSYPHADAVPRRRQDFNVPIIGGEQMYRRCGLGVPAQLVVYPGQHHVFTRPSFLKICGTHIRVVGPLPPAAH
jgi:dipeptidyl aminopeptidase/acylaminoacyl peptidase